MVFNCTIMSSPLHSTSLQRQVRDELWCTRSLLQEHFFLCFGRRILAGLFLRLVRLLKKCPYSCSCWAFCSSRSIKEPIEHPHNFYFGGLTPFPNKLKAKDNCIFKKRSQNLIIEKKKKVLPWQTLSTLAPRKVWLFANHVPVLQLPKKFISKHSQHNDFTTPLYQQSGLCYVFLGPFFFFTI